MTKTFAQLGLSEATLKAITELGYEEPTPIQEQTILVLQDGKDVIAQAQTGTGKTAAFALPIIETLQDKKGSNSPQALVLTPTRELAVQVAEAFHSYSKYHAKVKVLAVYGGQPIELQLRALKAGVDVIVGTPGRLLDHLRRGTFKTQQLRTVVLDEADEMLAMGFIEDIETILKQMPDQHQIALFSATMPAPIANLAQRYMQNPQRITVKAVEMSVPQIRQTFYEVGRRNKFEVLVRVLDYEKPTSAIVFCRTKTEVDTLSERLGARAYAAETLHGDLNQNQRDRVMNRFRNGQVELLIATDVAARGLDVEQVSHVINYDIPLAPDIYVHRIGRTGRAGRSGNAITLVTPRERRLWQFIQRVSGAQIQRLHLPTIADVLERRREAFVETIRETLAGEDLEPYLIMAEELGQEYGPTEVAAAAFKLLLGMPPATTEDTLAEEEAAFEDIDRNRQRDFRRRERNQFEAEQGMTRLYLNLGREQGIRPGDIVGALTSEADIPGHSIGAIDLYDHFTLVDVASNHAARTLKALKQTRIRNQKVTASFAKPDKPESNGASEKRPLKKSKPRQPKP
jgi:ATP-dependent RNA helicase DeaD